MNNVNSNNVNPEPQATAIVSDAVRVNARLGTFAGFLLVVLGTLAIASPFFAGTLASSLVAVAMIAAGLTITFFCFKADSFGRGFLQFFLGGFTVIGGTMMLVEPVLTLYSITGLLLVYFLVDGAMTVYSGLKYRPAQGWGWVVFSGLASIALGVLIGYGWPDSGEYAVGLLVGIRLLFAGWTVAMLGAASDAVGEEIGEVTDEQVEAFVEELEAELEAEANGPIAPAAQPA